MEHESESGVSELDGHADLAGAHEAAQATGASASRATQEQSLLQALARAEAGLTLEPDAAEGEEHLLFWLGASPYLVRLTELREVLPSVPPHVALPFSPQWLLGIFPMRTTLVALVDPAPTLLSDADAAQRLAMLDAQRATPPHRIGQVESPRALVVGEGDDLLALLVDHIGDICLLRAEDQMDAQQHGAASGIPGAAQEYVAGVYSIAGLKRAAQALRMGPLCADIFAALEERPAHE